MNAAACDLRTADKMPARPVSEGHIAAGWRGIIDPDLTTPNNEDAIMRIALIEDRDALRHENGAAGRLDPGLLVRREPVEKMSAYVETGNTFAQEKRGIGWSKSVSERFQCGQARRSWRQG